VVIIQVLSNPVLVNKGGRMYPHFREDGLRQKFLQPDALPNANLYHRSGKWPISGLLRQDGRPTILNLTEHGCMQ